MCANVGHVFSVRCGLFFSQLLSKTLDVVGEEEWVVEVGRCFGAQVPLYEAYPEEKVTLSIHVMDIHTRTPLLTFPLRIESLEAPLH